MNLNKLYDKQAKLDKHILEKHNIKMSKEELLDNTVLALLVEVSELANTTRCFKHWSTKGMMNEDIILDEYSDCFHFYLSIGNQIGYSQTTFYEVEKRIYGKECLEWMFIRLYYWIVKFDTFHEYSGSQDIDAYLKIGNWLKKISDTLNFTDEEQAYLKKHEENYKRQREGY